MKKNVLFFLLIFISSIFVVSAQYDLGSFYKYYQRITVRDGGRVLDQEGGQYDTNAHAGSYHGGTNQEWVVMPLFIKVKQGNVEISRDHIIASRKNGKILDVMGSTNLYCYPNFHGGDNQLFNLNSRPFSYWEISSPAYINKVFDKSGSSSNKNPFTRPKKHRNNIYMGNVHGGANQQFRFTNEVSISNRINSLRYQRQLQIPKPNNPTSFNEILPTETQEVFYSETLIPFSLVKNDAGFPPNIQVERSPYYRLERTRFYRIPSISGPTETQPDQTYYPGQSQTRTIRVKTGMKRSKVTEVSRKLNVSFTASKEVGITIPKTPISLKSSSSISSGLELQEKEINSYEETYEREETLTTTFSVSEPIRVVHYVLVDRYRLYRMDGTQLLRWDVMTNEKYLATFPEAKVEGNPGGRIFRIKPKPVNNSYNICWKDVVGLQVNGNALKKTNTTSWWNSGAASTGKLPSGQNGWIEMTASETNTYRMFGLSQTNTNETWNTIDYNFYLMVNGNIKIYEKGIFKTNGGTYKIGDKIRVERSGNKILYKKNGTIIYSSTTNPNISLMADVSMYTPNGTITNAKASFNCSSRMVESTIETPIVLGEKNVKSQGKADQKIKLLTKVYPNPTKGRFTFDFGQPLRKFSIQIFNISGAMIYERIENKGLNNHIDIDLSSQSRGVYFIKFTSEGTSVSKKIIKE